MKNENATLKKKQKKYTRCYVKFELVSVKSKKYNHYDGKVYDLTVEGDHSYNVDGVIVHNSICKTRIMTGMGVPTFASVLDAASSREINSEFSHVSILADGGIRYPADLAKSLAAGADAIICGKILAGSDEAPTLQIIQQNGLNHKVYRGAASEEIQKEKRGGLKKGTCAEGVSTFIKCTGSLENTLNDFVGGLKSSFTYVDATNLTEYRENTFFTKITEAGLSESHAFGTRQ
jgi:IMP dehydrogenase